MAAADSKATPKPGTDVGEAEVQQKADEVSALGYLGHTADPTPNEHYTVAGVVKGKPTPETDDAAALEALRHQSALNQSHFSGPTVSQDSK